MSSEGYDEYEDANPLIVEDEVFSKRPFTDRNKLTHMLNSLAVKTLHALQQDQEINHRYAIRMVISNRLKHHDNNGQKKKKVNEEFQVKLPFAWTAWNDMEADDIEIEFVRTVIDIHDLYKWYKVRIRATHFIDQQTREALDMIEAEENPEGILPEGPITTLPNVAQPFLPATSHPPPPTVAECNNNNQILANASDPGTYINNLNIADDDDDDIEILCEIPKS